MTTNIYLSLGSNMGDRRLFLKKATDMLAQFGDLRLSGEYANAADGFVSNKEFINIAAVLAVESKEKLTEADAMAFLRLIKGIEALISPVAHRNDDGSYRDREIDIDIIAIEGLRMASPELTLPHPRAAERAFVTIPLTQLIGKEATDALLQL